ncbi:MAG: 23S rRNA (pseudouridine(1915)-N(3))-methyltransferase RlmH [Sphingobacteriaceae bacterium]|nr:23S rRNA (pseudouridine(1915)-N(3))-methyltransferase RlmH [Sphingobacteriaceae bacterium]
MKITLIQIDKTQDSYLESGLEVFHKRLKNYTVFEVKTISMPKNVRQKSFEEQKIEEGKKILPELSKDNVVILLDDKGVEYTSEGFAAFIQNKQNASIKNLVFIIGGPYGFSEEIYKRANFKLSLSKLTFSHQMIRLFFAEQLYRAYTIIGGEKYHHK